jgi:hypothetical protein
MEIKEVVFNITTGETFENVRELTAEEIAQNKVIAEEFEAQQVEAQAQATARESALAKLKVLGLTQAEISAL